MADALLCCIDAGVGLIVSVHLEGDGGPQVSDTVILGDAV